MHRFLIIPALLAALVSVACAPAGTPAPAGGTPAAGAAQPGTTGQATVSTGYARPELLAETAWLAENLQNPAVRIVDIRTPANFNQGHIPGAVNLTTAQISDPNDATIANYRQHFQNLMQNAGISNNTQVVIYDDQGGLWATRLWYLLNSYGHTNAKVVNGGINKWTAESRPVSTQATQVQPATFNISENTAVSCDLQFVLAAQQRRDVVIIDARTAAEFNGSDVRQGSQRGGAVPNSINIDWQRNVTTQEPRVWRSQQELRRMYEQAGVTEDKELIVLCQTGVRAAHAMFTLNLIGFGKTRNYEGSWLEYGNTPSAPIRTRG